MTSSAHWPRPLATPLSRAGTRVLLLGAGELGKEVLIALQRFGVETIAVDRYAGAPGHQVAHRSHVIDLTDAAALRALIESERPHVVVPEIEAIATDALLAIERDGLARVVPTARAAQLTMNREGIRRLAAEALRLPTSPYRFAGSFEELEGFFFTSSAFTCALRPGTGRGAASGLSVPRWS